VVRAKIITRRGKKGKLQEQYRRHTHKDHTEDPYRRPLPIEKKTRNKTAEKEGTWESKDPFR